MTPLNIDQDSKDQISLIESEIDPMLAWNPSFNKQMGRSAFDLRWCMMTSGDMIFGKTDKIHDGHTYIGRWWPDQWPRMPFSYAGYSDTYLVQIILDLWPGHGLVHCVDFIQSIYAKKDKKLFIQMIILRFILVIFLILYRKSFQILIMKIRTRVCLYMSKNDLKQWYYLGVFFIINQS